MGKFTLTFLALGFFLFCSCDDKRVFDSYESLPNKWHRDSIVSFQFKAPDTVNDYNLFINLRNSSDYKYSNLFIITQMRFPNGKVVTDTLEYIMAKPTGEWLGTGFGEIKENKLWYKEDVQFSEAGTYTIEIAQSMRESGETKGIEKLSGVTEVGFRIEKSIN